MRKRALAGALLVVAMLSGCVGIPMSGGVSNGDLIDDQATPEFVALPSDPRPGSSQQEILEDFMQAVRAPQGGYAVARKFLTTEVADTWAPSAGALIRTSTTPDIEPAGTDSLNYRVSIRANVDNLGQYTEESTATSQSLTFGFALENDEWRISTLEDGIVLSQASFADAFREQAIYFFDPSFGYLVPDVRWFPATPTSSARVVEALLAGPPELLQQGVVTSAFPESVVLGEDRVETTSNGVVVDLSTEALSTSAQVRDRMRQQLIATLDTANVELTVGGIPLFVAPTSGNRAVVNPFVDNAALVGTDTEFGFDVGSGVVPIDGLSGQVVASGAVAAALTSDKQSAATLGADGIVRLARVGNDNATLIDNRPGLAAPSIDPFRFIWSAQAASAASLSVFETDGTPRELQTNLPAESRVVSLDVSRDGTRLLVLLSSPVGPQLLVYGIIRQDLVPIGLGGFVELPIASAEPLDATWVDDRSVAELSRSDDGTTVTQFRIGGPSVSLGSLEDASTIAGGNSAADSLRVLSSTGEIWRPRGSGGWVSTGISASFLGTKQ